MELVTLRARKALQKFPKTKRIRASLWGKDQHFYQRKFVQLITKKSTLVKNPLLTYSHLCAIVSYYLLIILFLTFSLQNLQINLISKFIIAIVQISPMLPFIKGLHALHFRSMIWLCFLSLVYFVHGIMNALSGAYNLFGWSEIICSLLLFISLAVCANTCKKR